MALIEPVNTQAIARRLLNVGGGSRKIPLPEELSSFENMLLDIDPATEPDVLCDARKLRTLEIGTFDAVYCSHNLEHYYRHDVRDVLAGFMHVLRPGGFALIIVPDMMDVMRQVVAKGLDIDDPLYDVQGAPILVADVIYGYAPAIERSGVDFFAHKTGFSQRSLETACYRAGFSIVYGRSLDLAITAIAFKGQPDSALIGLLGIPQPPSPSSIRQPSTSA